MEKSKTMKAFWVAVALCGGCAMTSAALGPPAPKHSQLERPAAPPALVQQKG